MRLSVDYHYQSAREPLTKICLKLQFQRLGWDETYREWPSTDFQYYWQRQAPTIAPWTTRYHDLHEEHLKEVIKLARAYKRRRLEMANKS